MVDTKSSSSSSSSSSKVTRKMVTDDELRMFEGICNYILNLWSNITESAMTNSVNVLTERLANK